MTFSIVCRSNQETSFTGDDTLCFSPLRGMGLPVQSSGKGRIAISKAILLEMSFWGEKAPARETTRAKERSFIVFDVMVSLRRTAAVEYIVYNVEVVVVNTFSPQDVIQHQRKKMRPRTFFLPLLFHGTLAMIFCRYVNGFAPGSPQSVKTRTGSRLSALAADECRDTSRRDLIGSMLLTTAAIPLSANAVEEKTQWITGKTPKIPGQKPKDPNDTRGTRKDPGFLRSISDCKSQCENANGSKSKEDCLSECQDICCTTYEQCTFAIVPRI